MTIDLRYFTPREFRGWHDKMSPRLLVLLDTFRHVWGRPVRISPATGALGRRDESNSQHNISRWGEVRAVDVMPHGMVTRDAARRAVDIADMLGFTGIGLYPDWRPQPGLHLDVRHDTMPGRAAEWGGVMTEAGQEYVSPGEALARFPEQED